MECDRSWTSVDRLRLLARPGQAQDDIELSLSQWTLVSGRRDHDIAVQLDLLECHGVMQAGVLNHVFRLGRRSRSVMARPGGFAVAQLVT